MLSRRVGDVSAIVILYTGCGLRLEGLQQGVRAYSCSCRCKEVKVPQGHEASKPLKQGYCVLSCSRGELRHRQ